MSDEDPIYRSRSYTKNGKHYWLKEFAWIFDCPHCETIRDHFSRENAITHMDVHLFHHHPEAHIPLVAPEMKEQIAQWFEDFRIRAFSPVAKIRLSEEQRRARIHELTAIEAKNLTFYNLEAEEEMANMQALLRRGREIKDAIRASRM